VPDAPTRAHILRTSRELLEEHGWPGVGLDQVAREAEVSREALQLHFPSRALLLLALVEFIDEEEGLDALVEHVQGAPSGLEELDRLVWFSATYEPRVRAAALAHDVARHGDPELERAWQARMRTRRRLCLHVVERLQDDGLLADGFGRDDAADLLWSLLSMRMHESLVTDRRWSRRRYEEHLRTVLRRALTNDRQDV
jgi:AcrR family transcriptional regulator